MNLIVETRSTFQWVLQILGRFLRVVPGTTLALVVYLTAARITRLLAFLLPLKVILLAGSNGVPHYFRPFLANDQKQLGIAILSAAAIAFYAITLFLEGHTKRLSDRAGADLMSAAGVMSLVDNQRAEMQGIYARFMQIVSGTLFVVVSMGMLAVLDPLLAAYLSAFGMIFYLLTAWALKGVTPLKRNWLGDFIDKQLPNYLSILSSVAFLSGFLVVLRPFLQEAGANVLVAIICFMLLRQMTATATGAIRDMVALAQKRHLADTLVMPDRQFHPLEGEDQRALRQLFGRQERDQLIADALAELRQPDQTLSVGWLDPPLRGMAEFSIVLQGSGGQVRHLRQRVFPPRLRRMLENEDLLFRHVAREAVRAAPVMARFMHGEHECIVYDAGTGVAPKGAALAESHRDFITALWCAELPPALLRIYSASHKPMHERLSEDLVARMDIAVDTDADSEMLHRFGDALPSIRKLIADLPLRLSNPGFTPAEIVLDADGAVRVLGGWGQWSLLPLGAGLPASLTNADKLAALLAEVRRRRPGMLADDIGSGHVMLVANCVHLERTILNGKMKAGLALAARVLEGFESLRDASTAGKAVPEARKQGTAA